MNNMQPIKADKIISKTFSSINTPRSFSAKKNIKEPINKKYSWLSQEINIISRVSKVCSSPDAFKVQPVNNKQSKPCKYSSKEIKNPRVELVIEQGGRSNSKSFHPLNEGIKCAGVTHRKIIGHEPTTVKKTPCNSSNSKKYTPSKKPTTSICKSHRGSIDNSSKETKSKPAENICESPRKIEIRVLCEIIEKLESELEFKNKAIEEIQIKIEEEEKKYKKLSSKNEKLTQKILGNNFESNS